jgi:hypothetical protein
MHRHEISGSYAQAKDIIDYGFTYNGEPGPNVVGPPDDGWGPYNCKLLKDNGHDPLINADSFANMAMEAFFVDKCPATYLETDGAMLDPLS